MELAAGAASRPSSLKAIHRAVTYDQPFGSHWLLKGQKRRGWTEASDLSQLANSYPLLNR